MEPSADATQKIKRPIRRTLLDEFLNVPNILTLARIVAIPFVAIFVLEDTAPTAFLAAIIYALAAITDMLDGYLARRNRQITVIGKFLDPLADKLMVLTIMLAMLVMKRIPLWVVALMLARELTITGLRAIASAEGMIMAAETLGKFKTAFQMIGLVGLLLFYPYYINFGFTQVMIRFHDVGLYFVYLSLVLSILSALGYFMEFFKQLKQIRAKSPEDEKDEEASQIPDEEGKGD